MLSSLPDVILEGYVVEAVVGNIHRATICGPTNMLANYQQFKSFKERKELCKDAWTQSNLQRGSRLMKNKIHPT